jgi:aldose 1-epimerase
MGLRLHAGDWEADIRPEIGGSIAGLRWRGNEVLRTMSPTSTSPLDASCFPLVPYCNRVANARFEWQGREVQLPRNFEPETSNLHGLGWEDEWVVASKADFKCALEHGHDGNDGWPWAYHAEQRIRLGPKGCAISLNLTNRGHDPMPAGLGLHPYFRRRSEARLVFSSTGVLMVDDGLIPTGEIAPPEIFGDWQAGAELPRQTIDHCHAGWGGVAHIQDDLGMISVTARGTPFLHLYAPEDGSALCLEPVSHTPDALNGDPAGMTILPPGCSATMTMWISAE